jgi:succinate dehydrogenase hydrophobic anchor subunit
MLASTLFAAAPVLFTVLVLTAALLAVRAVTEVLDLNHSRRLRLLLNRTILVGLVLFGVLVVVRFEALA